LLATNTLVSNAVSLLLSAKTDKLSPQTISTKEGDTFENLYEIRGNVGILNITGPIFRYGKIELCDTVYGTQHFSEVLANFEKNASIEEIVIQFNTGGGEASGISELSEQIASINKPTTAYIDDLCASAGYWLASACDKIVSTKSAFIGSIGVVFAFLDTSKMEEELGVETIEIVSTVSPNKRVDIRTDDGKEKIQVLADDLADVFVSSIATYRDVTNEFVKENFGKGDVMIASKALEAKMIDEIGTFEELIKKIQGDSMAEPKKQTGANTSTPPTEIVMTAEDFKKTNPIAYQEILTAGATAERERIEAIANINAPHYQTVIRQHMFDGKSTVTDVKVALFDAKADTKSRAMSSFAKGGGEMADALSNISVTHTGNIADTNIDSKVETSTARAIKKLKDRRR